MDPLWMEAAADIAAGASAPTASAPSTTSRKRPRENSPVPTSSRKANNNNNNNNNKGNQPDPNELVQKLQSPRLSNEALNTLMRLTANHEINYTLEGDVVLTALVDLVPVRALKPLARLDVNIAWTKQDVHPRFVSITQLHSVLVILRNLSFVAANLRPMAFHPQVLPFLITSLYLDSEHSDLLLSAMHTLVHLAPVLDVTGQRLLCDTIFVNNERGLMKLGFGGLKLAKQLDNDVLEDDTLVREVAGAHVNHIWCLFPALRHILTTSTTPRSVIMMAMDLLQELLDHQETSNLPSMKQILQEMPFDVLQRLVDLLWIPRLGPDALDYVNPLTNIVSRVSTLKLLMGYDATVDTDLRDRALDVLVLLVNLKNEMAGHMAKMGPRLYDALIPVLTTQVGRNDAPLLANSFLKALSRHKDNRAGLLYAQERILELASKDSRIAQVALGHLYQFAIQDIED